MTGSIERIAKWAAGAAITTLLALVAVVFIRTFILAGAIEAGLAPEQVAIEIRYMAAMFALLGVFCMGLFVFIAIQATASIRGPIHQLIGKVNRVGAGDFGERIPPEGPREVRDLASAVNAMVESLAWREERLLHTERLSAVGTLVAGVAHEVNNPLTALRLNEEILRTKARKRADDGRDADAQALLRIHDRNIDAIERIARIVGALKDMSRPAASDRAPRDVNRLVEGCLVIGHHRLDHVEVVREFHATRAAHVDAGEISQVILNVVMNAVEAMPDGGTLRVETRDSDDDGGILVRVADTGAGIPDAVAATLFDPFATTKPEGTGLGLAISRRIIESHGGTIGGAAAAGGGTVFTIRLPGPSATRVAVLHPPADHGMGVIASPMQEKLD